MDGSSTVVWTKGPLLGLLRLAILLVEQLGLLNVCHVIEVAFGRCKLIVLPFVNGFFDLVRFVVQRT